MKCPSCHKVASNLYLLKVHFIGEHLKEKGGWRSIEGQIAEITKAKEILIKQLQQQPRQIPNELQKTYDMIESLIDKFEPAIIEEPLFEEQNGGRQERKEEYFNLAHYIPVDGSSKPVCREERQFAHRLALWIEAGRGQEVFMTGKAVNLDWKNIRQVFFEATFMRDYWAATDRKAFNKKLYEFVESKIKEREKTFNTKKYGIIDSEFSNVHPNHWNRCHPLVRWMMNAKPDLAVLTNDHVLYFIECKYESGEDKYRSVEDDFSLRQLEVQELILDFVIDSLKIAFRESPIKKGGVIPVQFQYGEKPSALDLWSCVDISKLLSNPML